MHPAGARRSTALGCLVGLMVLVGATNAAGGDAAPGLGAVPGVVSGSRLRAMFLDGGDGALLFNGWFDSELAIRCAFVRTRDGQMRCLPTSMTAFRDSTCTMPVWVLPRSQSTCSGALPRYVTTIGIQGEPATAAYELGDPYTGGVRTTSLGICTSFVKKSDWGTYYVTGAEISSERFVAAVIRWLPIDAGGRLLRTEQADDGSSRVTIEVKDSWHLIQAWRAGALPADTFVYLGSGRLRVPMYEGPTGQLVEAPIGVDFLDTEAHAPCHPERFADGERCVPRASLAGPNAKVDVATSCTLQGDAAWASVADGVE
ncbi:MAG: hypothetical protein ACRENE_10870 [Polyangiaceae bacterium]